MKVALVSSGVVRIPPDKGGAVESHIVNISKHLKKYCNVEIFDRRFRNNDKDEIFGVKINRICSKTLGIHSRLDHIINEYLFSINLKGDCFKDFDIVHAHTLYVSYKLSRILKDKNFIYTCHNSMWCTEDINFYERYIVRKLEKKIIEKSTISIAVSETLRKNILKKIKIPEEKIITIYNGVDIETFKPNTNCNDIREKHNLDDCFVIVFVGRVAPAKGLEYLIKAVNMLKSYPIKTLIVGPFKYMFQERESKSSYVKMLVNLVRKYNIQDKIIFTDAVPKELLPKYYAVADVFILPSVYEAMGMVLVEAMASGKPLIGSKIGGIPEIIREWKNGLLFKPKDYKDLAEKILILMNDEKLKIKMGRSGRKIAEKEYSWEKIAEKLFKNVYCEVI